MAGDPATTVTTTTTFNPDINDHDLSGSGSGECFKHGFEFLPSRIDQPPFDNQLHTTPHDSDFSALLWTDTETDFLREPAPSNHDLDNMMLDSTVSVTLAAPPMENILGNESTSPSSCACMQQQIDLLIKSKTLNNAQPNDRDYNQNKNAVGQPHYDGVSDCPIKSQHLTIGAFQIQGEDRLLLLKAILLSTVRKLTWILTSLQKILEEKIDRFPSPQEADDGSNRSQLHGSGSYIQQMFHGLAGSLQSIQDFLNNA
ncbi:hypothetical protein TSTA_059460 [Talaromyces stipitatus ATCC 10500]|uniref:Aflatoxin regulatory protein domain-containing protein n=1 Tax=Talaromyces stipitatus (strain ATCC 10500 / CBS 375.48 / QM 6759 / NRRL 1006) TaxID=441959 RepID=B8MQN7_TALSN|nr:uncharacterized protein TSTA_059460 [Talaromyces stipitatus ATCC 10500]EED13460.1 hypothetical protein TSTA_059460 [Talaromyces stipitatus ATCC 10500]